MIRDFTISAENELKTLVSSINVCESLDGAEGNWQVGVVDVSGYVAKVKSYNRSILSQNDKTKTDIGRIFSNVSYVDTQYKNRLGNHATVLTESLDYMKKLVETLDPSISIMSPKFSLTMIANKMKAAFEKYSQGLVDYYMNMLRIEKVDWYGNTYYEYDFDYIRRIMGTANPASLPNELYKAMIDAFTDMSCKEKAQFILNSYFQNLEYEEHIRSSTWEISPVFMTMAALYELMVNNMDLSYQNLLNKQSDIHKYIANCAILNEVVFRANTLMINDNSLFQHPSYFFSVNIEDISKNYTEHDYIISFPRKGLPDVAQPISIYQFRTDLSGIDEKYSKGLLESFKKNISDEMLKKVLGVVQSKAIGFLELAGPIKYLKEGTQFVAETLLLFRDVDIHNQKVDNLIALTGEKNTFNALQMGVAVSITPDCNLGVLATSFDISRLNMAIRAYELADSTNLKMNGEDIAKSFNNGTLNLKGLEGYRDWYLEFGETKTYDYRKELEKKLRGIADKQGTYLSEEEENKIIEKLSYKQMEELEKGKYSFE